MHTNLNENEKGGQILVVYGTLVYSLPTYMPHIARGVSVIWKQPISLKDLLGVINHRFMFHMMAQKSSLLLDSTLK